MSAGNKSISGFFGAIRRRWLVWLLQVALLIAVFAGVSIYRSQDVPRGLAPPLGGIALDGRPVSLSSLHGKSILLHFWASWCGICRFEQGSIDAIADDHAVITVATQSGSRMEVSEFVKEQGITAPVIVDDTGELARIYGIRGFPTTLIIDPSGHIRNVQIGYSSEWGLRARLWWYSH